MRIAVLGSDECSSDLPASAEGPELPVPVDPAGEAGRELADQLVEEARATGVLLVGPGGLLADITKRVLETGLEVEMSEHLGYDKHAPEGDGSGNSRNGTRFQDGDHRDRAGHDRCPSGPGRDFRPPDGAEAPAAPPGRRLDGDLAPREGPDYWGRH